MVLIGSVEDVVDRQYHGCRLMLTPSEVGASGEMQQGVRGCGCLSGVYLIIMVLAEVALHAQGDVCVVEEVAVVGQLIFQVGVPSWCRCEGQVLALVGLMELYGVNHREAVAEM